MSMRLGLATAQRVLSQTVHDRRTLALVLVAPLVLETLMHYLFENSPIVDRLELQLLIIFPIFIMFLLTAIATVRERTSGTMERLLSTPLGKVDLIAGYALAYTMDAATELTTADHATAAWAQGMGVSSACLVVLLLLAATTLRRRTR